jgi:hypothetical protein
VALAATEDIADATADAPDAMCDAAADASDAMQARAADLTDAMRDPADDVGAGTSSRHSDASDTCANRDSIKGSF